MANVDLHLHSAISGDADYDIEDLLQLAKQAKLDVVAITDHNKVGNVLPAIELFAKHQIKVIPAIEIDCRFDGIDIHVLGYDIDVTHPMLEEIEHNYHEQDKRVTWQMVDRLSEIFGIEFDKRQLEDIAKDGVIVPEDVAELLINDQKYAHLNWIKPYLPGGLRSDNPYVNFYWDMMAQNRVAHVEMSLPDVRDIVSLIHEAGGKAVLAHPGNNFKQKHNQLIVLFDQIELDGIEVCSSYHSESQTKAFYDIAKEKDLLMTCGSDFHGKNKPSISMGKIEFYGLPENEFYR